MVVDSKERNRKISKNIIGTFLFKGGGLIVNLLLVPMTISFVSATEYGIWLTLSSIITWFGISDIGFGHGLRNRFAEAVAKDNKQLARSYVSTTYVSISLLALLLWVIFFIINNFLDWSIILNTDKSIEDDLSKVAFIVFSFFTLQFIFKLIGTVLTANQEPAKGAGFDFIANIFILGSIYLMMQLNINGSLTHLAIITGSFQLIVYLFASLYFYNSNLKEYKPSFSYFKIKIIPNLLGLGIKFFFIQIAMVFIFQCTNIIIAQILGPEQVTVYNIAYKYFSIPMTVALIVVSPLWSAFTDAYVKKDYVWMRKINNRLNYSIVPIILIMILFYIFSDFVYKKWIGDAVYVPSRVSLAMCCNVIAATFFSTKISIINGLGKIKLQLIIIMAFSFIIIPLMIYLCRQYELEGIIYSVFLVYSVLGTAINIQANKLVCRKAKGIFDQ